MALAAVKRRGIVVGKVCDRFPLEISVDFFQKNICPKGNN
jgi:hypothetical protein